MKKIVLKSYCKINLTLKVKNKVKKGYHNIDSLITFCDLHDKIKINKISAPEDKINFFGKFKKGIKKKSNSVTQVLKLLRKNNIIQSEKFNISVEKNIPHGSGLGGGSSNAAVLLNYFKFISKRNLKKNKVEKLARKIGFDVPISLVKKNIFLSGNKIKRISKKFNFDILIVYPNLVCSTKKIYNKNSIKNYSRTDFQLNMKNRKKLISFLKEENNDLEKTVVKIYPKVGKLINYIKSLNGCYFSRITGSGSACIGIFSSFDKAKIAKKSVKLKYPNYWSVVSKTI